MLTNTGTLQTQKRLAATRCFGFFRVEALISFTCKILTTLKTIGGGIKMAYDAKANQEIVKW